MAFLQEVSPLTQLNGKSDSDWKSQKLPWDLYLDCSDLSANSYEHRTLLR